MGSKTVTCNGSSGGKYNLTLNYWVNYQDTVANTSNIYVEATLQRNDGYAGSYYNLIESQNSAYIDVGGARRVSRNLKIDTRNSAVVTLASWSGNVSHNADGTLTLSIGTGFSTSGTSSLTGGSVTDSWTLTTIPRKSDFSISPGSVEAGKTITVTISPASSSFSHKVTYAFGSNSSSSTLSAGNKTSTKTIPLSWLTAIPDNTSGTASVIVETFSGGTSLGTITRYFTVICPESVKPSISSVTVTRIDNNVPPSWGIFVKGESQARVSVAASGIYGSTIKSYQITGAGYSGTSSTLTTGVLQAAGTYTFTAKVTDSRPGRTDTAVSEAITVYDYAPPTLSVGDVFRCNVDGTRNDGGNYLSVTANITVNTLGGRNAGTLSYSIARVGQSPGTYTAITPGAATVIPNVSSDYSYTLYLKVSDQIHSPTPTTIDIATAAVTLNFAAGGKGIGVGKVSEKGGLEVAWPAYLTADTYLDGRKLLDRMYPVGSIYLSVTSTNPSTLIGGTWVRWGSGRVPVSVNTADSDFSAAGKTGGEKTHKLTVAEMPSHYHASDGWAACDDGAGNYVTLGGMPGGGTQYGTRYTGGDQPHNNMPPYITCYMWQRTA